MKKFSLLICVITIAGCSSTPGSVFSKPEPDQVLSRINDMSSRPSWLDEQKPFEIKNANVVCLGQTTIPGDHRVEAAYAIAENNAKGAICSAIESRLDFVLQNAEEGTAIDSTQVRRIGAEACKITTSSIRPGNHYWEKVAMSTFSGEDHPTGLAIDSNGRLVLLTQHGTNISRFTLGVDHFN